MDWEIVWTERASSDLKEIVDYLAPLSPAAAEKVAQDIVDRVELLRSVPRMGKPYSRNAPAETRVIVNGKYRVFYNVSEEDLRVLILTIRHGSRDEPTLTD